MASAAGVAGFRESLDLGSESSKCVQCGEPDSARITGKPEIGRIREGLPTIRLERRDTYNAATRSEVNNVVQAWDGADLLRTTIQDYAKFVIRVMHDEGLSKEIAAERATLTRDRMKPEDLKTVFASSD